MAPPLAIGLGTGRCGTRSLTKLFNEHGFNANHEKHMLPWEPDYESAKTAINDGSSVAFYWLPYVEWIRENYEVRFVCLKRNRDEVVNSYVKDFGACIINSKVGPKFETRLSKLYDKSILDTVNESTKEWMLSAWDDEFDINGVGVCLPDYDVPDRKAYVERYWDDYYKEAERHTGHDFIIMDMDKGLNTEEGRNIILTHIGAS